MSEFGSLDHLLLTERLVLVDCEIEDMYLRQREREREKREKDVRAVSFFTSDLPVTCHSSEDC
jgi:hypothetical protein